MNELFFPNLATSIGRCNFVLFCFVLYDDLVKRQVSVYIVIITSWLMFVLI